MEDRGRRRVFEGGLTKKRGERIKLNLVARRRAAGRWSEEGLTGKAFWGRIKRFARIREKKRPERSGDR